MNRSLVYRIRSCFEWGAVCLWSADAATKERCSYDIASEAERLFSGMFTHTHEQMYHWRPLSSALRPLPVYAFSQKKPSLKRSCSFSRVST